MKIRLAEYARSAGGSARFTRGILPFRPWRAATGEPIPAGRVNRKMRTFTLIELLVVIAIIAILAAILLPALKKAKDLGYWSACSGNHRQINLALLNYADSYDSLLPLACNKDIDTNLNQWNLGTQNWDMLIAGFLNVSPDPLVKADVMVCPADKVPNHMGMGPEYVKKSYLPVVVTTTADNFWPGPGRTAIGLRAIDYGRDYRSRRLSEVRKPTLAALTCESAHCVVGVWWKGSVNWRGRGYNTAGGCGYIYTPDSPHVKVMGDFVTGENISWVDGHVEKAWKGEYGWTSCPGVNDGIFKW